MANIINNLIDLLILAHNKTLAAQLWNSNNFSQQMLLNTLCHIMITINQAYVSSRDIYIEKEAQINDEIERLRHSATQSCSQGEMLLLWHQFLVLWFRTPEAYLKVFSLKIGDSLVDVGLKKLTEIYYDRNDLELKEVL